ncbi:MAG: RNA polymerase sigma-70 factor [Odoribacteraceae bacterium]|jgi:RNA polymerase sigma-70 factor (ECF subfamily)|nr:RNA polymerase sigma-70 factor [Odoribacteraceae bacterium]
MDQHAFEHFVRLHSDDLLYYVRGFFLSREEAEEIVSDVFFEVWQNREKIDEIVHPKAWLVTIAHNKTISHLRKKKHERNTVSWEEVGDHVVSGNLQTPDEQIISQENMDRINSAISTLPSRCHQVFVLAKIERVPYKEIASMLGISVKTINIHVSNSLRLISEALKK